MSAPSNDSLPGAAAGDGSLALLPAPDVATFFAVSLDLLVIRDSALNFVKVNHAWTDVLGYAVEELEGQPMLAFIHPEDAPASRGHMRRMEVEEEVNGFINRYRRRDGTYRHLEWRARRVGEFVYGVARDVTERLAIEAEMAKAKLAAEAANRAKSDFLANMSHEIRTPLNGVVGIATALARTPLDPQQGEMVELILTSGKTLERVVSDVLDISKIEAGRLEIERRPFDLRAELGGLVEMFRLRAEEKGLAFPVRYGAGLDGAFEGDVVRIRQVLGNLLSNAIKFTAAGEVGLSAEVREEGPAGPARLCVEVWDTGVGFDDAFAEKLFQRFSQADESITRRFGGTGLGLSISRGLVEMMGGEIRAASTPGRGSRFGFELPLPRAAEAAVDAPAEPAGEASLAGLRVLLAEDHPVNRRVVELILGPFGVELAFAETGEEAVRAHASASFDLILMDMQMPVLDGLAASRAIRAAEAEDPSGRRTPIVMLSANALPQHRKEALAAGADRHLAKPVTAAALIEAVAAILNGERCGRP